MSTGCTMVSGRRLVSANVSTLHNCPSICGFSKGQLLRDLGLLQKIAAGSTDEFPFVFNNIAISAFWILADWFRL